MKMRVSMSVLISLIVLAALAVSPALALPDKPKSMNARFVKWQAVDHVVHIFVFDEAGCPGQPPAVIGQQQPILFGFEYGGESVAQLQADLIDNPDHDLTLSIDGGDPFSVKGWYQSPFVAETQSGPAWSWDHDGDGPGDGDEDGIGDWSGPVLFFRYQSPGLGKGMHTFQFCVHFDDGNGDICETITVMTH
jgi:hypothetical protein